MSNDAENNGRPVPEVLEKPQRRRFTAEYKMRIIEEADGCTDIGQVGELLRREGLYASHLSNWRRLRKRGSLASLKEKKRGRKRKQSDAATLELKRLQRENQRLTERLRQAETIIDVQKKVCEMLGIATPQNETDSDE
jgi:transposase-like protein